MNLGNQPINYNLLGNTGEVNWFRRWMLEPFITFEEPRSKDGSLWRGAKKVIISMTLEMVGVILLTLVVAGTAAGGFGSGLNVSLIGLVVGLAHAGVRYGITGWRHTPYLPRDCSPTFTAMRMFHGELGFVYALLYMGVQYGGGAISSAILCALQLTAGDEWRGVGKFGVAAQLSDVSAWALYSFILFTIGFVELFNGTVKSERFSYTERSNHASGLVSYFIVGLSLLSVQFGIYSNNEIIAFTGGLAAGNLSSIGDIKWVILLILAPLTASILIPFLKWLLWNVSDIDVEDKRRELLEPRLKGSTSLATGGVPHTMDGRKEVDSQMRSGNSSGSLVANLLGNNKKGRKHA